MRDLRQLSSYIIRILKDFAKSKIPKVKRHYKRIAYQILKGSKYMNDSNVNRSMNT